MGMSIVDKKYTSGGGGVLLINTHELLIFGHGYAHCLRDSKAGRTEQ